MKSLSQYIYEGLFNVDKNISDTHEIEKNMFNDMDSDWWKYMKVYNAGDTDVITWGLDGLAKEIDIDKEKIHLDANVGIDSSDNPFLNRYTLYCNNFHIGSPRFNGPHPDPIANGGGFKEINCTGVTIDGMCEKLEGFKFNINPNKCRMTGMVKIGWASDLDYFDAEFNFEGNVYPVLSLVSVTDFPNLKYIKSNAKTISIYDCSFFNCDGIKSKLDKFFGKGTVIAAGITKTKSTRNIVAIVNNIRKYGSLIPTEVIPEGKLSDLLDLSGFKNIETVTMRSNNVRMTFVKPNNNGAIMRQARFIRMNNMKLFKDTPIDELVDMVKKCQTKDGWVVLFEPEQF
jgi:hypothetical protein